ncbi:MAG: Rieske (2Fe-2S) protein [Chloroflexota bacterium]|nr:Rieske (2Fe-2S) protein [Chloroflexota bacterium]
MSEIDRLDRALDKLASGQSPRDEAKTLGPEEQAMLRMAQFLRGSEAEGPEPEFTERLHRRLEGGRVSRKAAVWTGLAGLAAGIAAAVGVEQVVQSGAQHPAASSVPLVGQNGKWYRVATVAEVGDGATVPFTAGAVQGFLLHRAGKYRALSRICTHMGCALKFSRDERGFVCPCHGAEFDLQGNSRYGPGGYTGGLPPLPEIEVRVRGEHLEVKGV